MPTAPAGSRSCAQQDDPLTYAYLKALGRRIGVEISVNTSFNVAGPIAQTPQQAIDTLRRSKGLDVVLLVARRRRGLRGLARRERATAADLRTGFRSGKTRGRQPADLGRAAFGRDTISIILPSSSSGA